MEVLVKKSFIKDFKKIPKHIQKRIEIIFEELIKAKSIKDIRNIKKIKGYTYYYRIRLGDYRIGLKYENGRVVLYRVLHRSQIYKYFP